MQTGAVHIVVRIPRDDHDLVVDASDRARIDIASDAVVPSHAELDIPRTLGRTGRLCARD
jgi:hypothetical protein